MGAWEFVADALAPGVRQAVTGGGMGGFLGPLGGDYDGPLSELGSFEDVAPGIDSWSNPKDALANSQRLRYLYGDSADPSTKPNVMTFGPQANAAFDPFAYQVDGSAYAPQQGSVVASAGMLANRADQAGQTAAGRATQAWGAGTAATKTGLQTTGQALANAQALERTAANLGTIQQQQGRFAGTLESQYAGGTDPSAAMAQLQAGKDAATRSNLALARSTGNPAALYQAQLANAGQVQAAANQAAQLRAQEQQAVRGDVLAARQAQAQTGGLAGQQFSAGGQLRLQTGGQQAEIGAQQMQAAQGQQAIQQGMLGAANAAIGTQSSALATDQNAAMARETARQNAFESGRKYATDANIQRFDALDSKNKEKQQEQAAVKENIGLGIESIGSIVGSVGGMSDERSKQRIKKLEAENSLLKGSKAGYEDPDSLINRFSAEQGSYDPDEEPMGKPVAREPAARAGLLRSREADDEQRFLAERDNDRPFGARAPRGMGEGTYDPWGDGEADRGLVDPWGVQSQARTSAQDDYQREYQSALQAYGGALPAAAQQRPAYVVPSDYSYGGATSDARAKRDVEDMFDPLEPVSYEYRKPEYGPPGRRAGILAQDLEKSELGRNLVSRDEKTGMRVVDTPQLTLANTAEIKMLREKIAALEGGRR